MHKQSERESYSHRKRTTVIIPEGINYQKNNLRILAAVDSCLGLGRPRQHGIANT